MGPKPAIVIDQLVLVNDETLASTKWQLGRIEDMHTGSANNTRVVTLLTIEGVKKRPIAKISSLPLESATSAMSDEEIDLRSPVLSDIHF